MIFPHIYFLQDDEQLLIEGFSRRWVVNGPGRVTTPAFHKVSRRKALLIEPVSYLRIQDTKSGEVHNEIGPKLYFLKAHEEVVNKLQAIALKNNQYIRLMDSGTGKIRVERGEKVVYLEPSEEILETVRQGINIDEINAVLVRNLFDGQLTLITTPQVFVPESDQEIVDVRKRIRLEDHETVVIKDLTGRYLFRTGRDPERAFFLAPYSELVTFHWSSGIHKDRRDLQITRIDTRPKFMWYEFEARTQDNVELVIGITFFWQIVDVPMMIKATDDTPGDVCAHARSAIIQAVSQVPLERFLALFNSIVREAIIDSATTDSFYSERGIELHAVEVRSITCKDANTQRILQEIIEETTNRLNRLQKQESENEVTIRQVQGEIEAEEKKGRLIELRRERLGAEGETAGLVEANRVKAYLLGLGEELPTEGKILLFNALRKHETLQKLSEGSAQIYFTPADVNLSIESR